MRLSSALDFSSKLLSRRLVTKQKRQQGRRRLLIESLETRAMMDGSPVISEILAANSGGLSDADGDSSDWLELYNPTSSSISLDGWFLTDTQSDLNEWRFPAVELGPNQFLTVFASGKNRAVAGQELHTNFKLSTSGEYLALVQPNGTIVDEYTPKFPAQVSNVSFGSAFLTDTLIDDGSSARFFVPSDDSLETTWTQAGIDTSSWIQGKVAAGFGVSEPGFDVTYMKANLAVNDLDVARSVVSTPSLRSTTVQSTTPTINYLGTGSGANFGNDFPFPTQSIGEDVEDFVVMATTSITIPSTGPWTFGVNSDDGFSLVLERNGVQFHSEYFSPRAPDNTLAAFDVQESGEWNATLIMYERGGGASVELFAAQGSLSSFDSTFRLVGDTANGGLAASRGLPVRTDLQNAMLGVNATVYSRIEFNVVDPSLYDALLFRINYDDGFVAYLNGVEVARRNAPTALSFNASAPLDRSSSEVATPENISLTPFLNLLTTGKNILSIQALNSSATDPSFLLDTKLTAIGFEQFPRSYFALPTPGEPNSTPYDGVVDRVVADHAGGFYNSSFQVALSTPTTNASIKYTIDGSTPTASHGIDYTGPITVSGTTTLRAGAFKTGYVPLPTISRTYLFLSDVLTQSPDGTSPPGWPSTWGNNVVDYGLDPDVIQIEGASKVHDALLAIPSLAVSTDLGNLFDTSTGIYGNAFNDGREWERPASLELLNPDGSTGFQVNAGIRIRGGYSRSPDNPKHAFRFFFRGEYGDSSLDFPLFGTEGVSSFKKIDLRTAQNYSWSFGGDPSNTMLADNFARETQRDLGQPYTRSRWYHLYINGQYWGLYQTQERAEAEYAASYFGGIASNYDVIKPEAGPYIITATDGNDEAYRRLWTASVQGYTTQEQFMRVQGKNVDGTDNPNYEVLLDVDNLIVYMVDILYGGNLDAPISNFLGNNAVNNFFAVRDRTGRSGFKFFQHDSEHTLLPWNLNENRNGPYPAGQNFQHFNPQWLHQQLMANEEYRIRFGDIVQKAFFDGGPLTVAAAQSRYQNQMNVLDQAIIAESARWGDAKRPSSPLMRSDWLNATAMVHDQYLTQRGEIVLNQWRAIGLFPNLAAPSFLLNGQTSNGGQITAGSSLRFTATGGLVYYTQDGSDPRLVGGGISPNALIYDPSADPQSQPAITISSSVGISARTLSSTGEWSAIKSADFITAERATASNVAITELMYNPPAPSGSELVVDKEDYEYLEFRNIGTQTISLADVRFTAGITYNFNNADTLFIPAGQTFVLAKNLAAFRSRYGNAPLVVGSYASSGSNLSNGGETITLVDATDTAIQSFTYDDVAPWPTSPDGGGDSLTVRWTSGNYSSASNWRASYVAKGTPGIEENDYPEQLSLSADTMSENATNVTIGLLSALDPNAGDTIQFSLQPGTDSDLFRIVGNQLQVGANGLDFEASATRSIVVIAKDRGGLAAQLNVTIKVTNENEAPTSVLLDHNTLAENLDASTTVGILSALDPDAGSSHTFSLVDGNGSADNASFTIVNNELRSNTSFNFESKSSYTIRVRATDAGLLVSETTFIIGIVDQNDSPSNITLSNSVVPENRPQGTVLGTLSVVDEDVLEGHTLSFVPLVGNSDDTKFEIVGGELRTKVKFNFEKKASYQLQVKATDNGGKELLVPMTITIQDVAEQSPVTVGDNAILPVNGITAIHVLSNDSDADDTLNVGSVRIVTSPTSGIATVLSDGRIQFTPNLNFHGTDTLSYTVDDSDENTSNISNVTIRMHSIYWNPLNALDVDADKFISPLDILALVNDINFFGPRSLPQDTPPQAPYFDVDDDLSISPLDILIIINYLNGLPGIAGPEGESTRSVPSPLHPNDVAMASWLAWDELQPSGITKKRAKS